MIETDSTTHRCEIKEEQLKYQEILRVKSEYGAEDVYYSVFYESLPDEFKENVEKTLGETATSKENGLRRLKEYMKKENLSATDDLLITVLRGCKYNLKKSETKLKNFLRSRQNIIKKLNRVDEEKMKLILRDGMFTILPYRDKHGRAIVVTKPTVNLDQYSMDDVEPVVMSLILYVLTFPLTTVCGVTYLAECKCDSIFVFYPIIRSFRPYVHYSEAITLPNLAKLLAPIPRDTHCRYTIFLMQMDLPLRIRRADLVNENILVRLCYNAIRPLLPTKMTNRIFFHGHSYESLNKIYPPDMLPQDMEGKLGPMSNEFLKDRLFKFMQTLREEAIQD